MAMTTHFSPICSINYHNKNLNFYNGDHTIVGLSNAVRSLPATSEVDFSRVPINSCLRGRTLTVGRWRLNAVQLQILEKVQSRSPVEIPVTCYQIVGVPNQAEKDEIVKSVMELKGAEIEEGYTIDALVSRQELLMDVRDKLLFEPEYAGNMKEKIAPKSSLRIPWTWLPGALCLLQEVGEETIVLDIGRAALQHPDAKPYIHDLLLSMALAECAIAKTGFEKNNVSQGFEALARAQCLLRSKISLGKMKLLSQIEESLEELAPACTLELLGLTRTPENAGRRRGAIAALHELLRQGLDVESSCQVQDWPCFLSQALNRLLATEIVDILPWDSLAITRKNKKSLESQNQRVVIDFNCFYTALMAHIALGFSSKQSDLINKAKTICECLMASEGIDLKFEEAFCSFLLGQGDEAKAVEKLQQLELNANSASRSRIPGKEIKDSSAAKPLLEIWLKDAVLGVFPDTRDCCPSLINFFGGEKRQSKGGQEVISSVSERRNAALSDGTNSFRHHGSAVKQLAQANMESLSTSEKKVASVEIKKNVGREYNKVWTSASLVTVVGCIVLVSLQLSGMKFGRWGCVKPNVKTASSLAWSTECCNGRLKKLVAMVKMKLSKWPADAESRSDDDGVVVYRKRSMALEEAENLVKQWQVVKAEALGPNHQVDSLSEILDESMLVQWQDLADAAKAKSCFWRFVLLKLSVVRADILSDGMSAEIEALLEEAAELVDESQPKKPNYYSTYKICYILRRQDDGSWRFCEGDIQMPS